MNQMEKSNLMLLTVRQRKTALALKNIFDSIRQVQQSEAAQLKSVYLSYIPKFDALQQQSRQIIRGTKISNRQIANNFKYFLSSQIGKVKGIINKKVSLPGYWFKVFGNYFGEAEFNKADKAIAAAIIDLYSEVNQNRLSISIQLTQNRYIESGKITKIFILNKGQLVRVQGNAGTWLRKCKSIFGDLLSVNLTREQSLNAFDIAGDIIHDVIPYSFQYYLAEAESLLVKDQQQSVLEFREKDLQSNLRKILKS